MKNIYLVLLLALMHAGCATPTVTPVERHTLISYDEIAAEIKIEYQASSGADEITRPVAANLPNSE